MSEGVTGRELNERRCSAVVCSVRSEFDGRERRAAFTQGPEVEKSDGDGRLAGSRVRIVAL
jgi:hypothetical protein